MRILHVYKAYPPIIGGIELHVRDVARAQAARGHAVTVLCMASGRSGDRRVEDGVTIARVGRLTSIASAPLGPGIVGAMRRESPDLTHLHSPWPPGELAWLAFGRRPMVLTYHADIVRQKRLGRLWAPWQARVFGAAERIVAGSPVLAATAAPLAPHAERVRVVPYGVDVERFDPTPERRAEAQRLRREDPWYAGRFVVAFVGRLRYYKGLDTLIQALAECPDVGLVAVGTGPMESRWRALAAQAGVEARIRWLGEVSDARLPAVLHAADAYVFPSSARSESFGIAMAEAMAAGLPVISTELGTGTSWVNAHGITGLVVPPRSPQRLASAIRELARDPVRAEALGRAAHERAKAVFSRDAMLAALEAVYAEALETARPDTRRS